MKSFGPGWRATTAAATLLLTGVPGSPALSTSHGAGAQQIPDSARDALLAQATQAVNTHRIEDLTPLTAQDAVAAFSWVPPSRKRWEGTLLPLPFPEPTAFSGTPAGFAGTLAVFHAWHSAQSDGDHVHRLLQTPDGWRLGAEILETNTLGFRVHDHDLHVTFDVPARNATLSDTIQVERTADSLPPFGLLRISHDFHVQSITLSVPAGKTAVRFRQAGGVIAFAPVWRPSRQSGKRLHSYR
jgi:hypothetical protein